MSELLSRSVGYLGVYVERILGYWYIMFVFVFFFQICFLLPNTK